MMHRVDRRRAAGVFTWGVAVLVWLVAVPAQAQDAKAVVAAATKAMGVTNLTSVVFRGSAAEGNFGQSRRISFGLASTSIRNYQRAIDFTAPASHATGEALPPAPRGGAEPQPFDYTETVTAATPGWAQQLQIWGTPWGFLKGAASAPTVTLKSRTVEGVAYRLLEWSPVQKSPYGKPYRVIGYINAQDLVERVETWVEHPLMGDLNVLFTYSDYRDVGGLQVPLRLSQKLAGMETFVVAITQARANPPILAEFMPAVSPAPAAAPTAAPTPTPALPPVGSERLADGVYRITGGYVSLAVEFKDHVIVLEGGESEARGLAVIAETKRLFPSKRIKYVVNTHPHFDHALGLPPFVAEGITVITDDNSKFWVGAAMSEPRTLAADVLAKSGKKPKVEGVIDVRVLKDDTRTLELHHVEGLQHSDAMLIGYLPGERILFTADFNPPRPGQPMSPSLVTLVENLERLKLDVDRHVTVHAPVPDRPLTRADLDEWVKGAR